MNREQNSIMNEHEITVLKVEPGKAPEQITIPNTLKAMQELVGSHIEVVDYQGACLVCNEEGKLLGLEPNRRVGQDVITGTFFLANSDLDGNFCSLSQEDLAHFQQQFAQPEALSQKDVQNAFGFRIIRM